MQLPKNAKKNPKQLTPSCSVCLVVTGKSTRNRHQFGKAVFSTAEQFQWFLVTVSISLLYSCKSCHKRCMNKVSFLHLISEAAQKFRDTEEIIALFICTLKLSETIARLVERHLFRVHCVISHWTFCYAKKLPILVECCFLHLLSNVICVTKGLAVVRATKRRLFCVCQLMTL